MPKPKRPVLNHAREHRVEQEIVVDAYTSDERTIGWHCYLDGKLRFPFKAKCVAVRFAGPEPSRCAAQTCKDDGPHGNRYGRVSAGNDEVADAMRLQLECLDAKETRRIDALDLKLQHRYLLELTEAGPASPLSLVIPHTLGWDSSCPTTTASV